MHVGTGDNTKLERARTRSKDTPADNEGESSSGIHKRTRSSCDSSIHRDVCFFFGQSSGLEQLHEVSTFKTDKRVRR